MISSNIDYLVKRLVLDEHKKIDEINIRLINDNDLYILLSISILCLLSGDQASFSKFMAILIRCREKIPHTYTIQYSYMQLMVLINIASIKFNDFHSLSNQMLISLTDIVKDFFKKNPSDNLNLFVDSSKGILPYLSFIIEMNFEDDSWCQPFSDYLTKVQTIDNLYNSTNNFDGDRLELFPTGYLDLSRAHGITSIVSILGKIRSKKIKISIPKKFLNELVNIINIAYVENDDIALWSPYLIKGSGQEYKNASNFSILQTQMYCWCSGSLGMNKAISQFSLAYKLNDLNTKCVKVNESVKTEISLVSNDYFMCHGYASAYLNLNEIYSVDSKIAQINLEGKLINYLNTKKFEKLEDFFIIDGPISVLFALLINSSSNQNIRKFLNIFFMRD